MVISRRTCGAAPSRSLSRPAQCRVLEPRVERADSERMWERCRYCGFTSDRLVVLEQGERACPTCAGSPLCDQCGHPRAAYVGVFTSSERACQHVWEEPQTGYRATCSCDGFAPVVARLRDAAFTAREVGDDLPPLRIARPGG